MYRLLILLLFLTNLLSAQTSSARLHVGLGGSTFFATKDINYLLSQGLFRHDLPKVSVIGEWHPAIKKLPGLWFNLQARLHVKNRRYEDASVLVSASSFFLTPEITALRYREEIKERGLFLYPGFSYHIGRTAAKHAVWPYFGGGASISLPWTFTRTLTRTSTIPVAGFPNKQVIADDPFSSLGWYAHIGFKIRLGANWLVGVESRIESLWQSAYQLNNYPEDYLATNNFYPYFLQLYDQRIHHFQLQILRAW